MHILVLFLLEAIPAFRFIFFGERRQKRIPLQSGLNRINEIV